MTGQAVMRNRLLILYTPRARTPFHEHVGDDQLAAMAGALADGGWQVELAAYAPDQIAATLARTRPELVFNLAYGFEGPAGRELQPETARRLEELCARCVGATAGAQQVAQDKHRTSEVARRAGIGVPRRVSAGDAWAGWVVRKPRFGACHRDVTIVDRQALPAWNDSEYVVESYIAGEEYTVGVLQLGDTPIALPVMRLAFAQPAQPHTADFARFPWSAVIERDDRYALRALALRCFRVLDLQDYARFDIRIGPHGPVLLDANALPNLAPGVSVFPRLAHAQGLAYPELIRALARAAARRHRLA